MDLTFILLSSVRSNAMLFCSLSHKITAWYLFESIPYDSLLASSTSTKFLHAKSEDVKRIEQPEETKSEIRTRLGRISKMPNQLKDYEMY